MSRHKRGASFGPFRHGRYWRRECYKRTITPLPKDDEPTPRSALFWMYYNRETKRAGKQQRAAVRAIRGSRWARRQLRFKVFGAGRSVVPGEPLSYLSQFDGVKYLQKLLTGIHTRDCL